MNDVTPHEAMERYLIVYGHSRAGATQFQLRVCTEREWLTIYRWYGWFIVATDPDPTRPIPWEDDAA